MHTQLRLQSNPLKASKDARIHRHSTGFAKLHEQSAALRQTTVMLLRHSSLERDPQQLAE